MCLGELKRLEFLYEENRGEEPVYVFRHALTQDVAYDSLLTRRASACMRLRRTSWSACTPSISKTPMIAWHTTTRRLKTRLRRSCT